MASFVTEVLANSGRLEKEDLGTKISRLSRRVEELKGEVCDMINKKYDEFLPSMQCAEDLVTQVHGLASDVDVLKSRIETEVKSDLKVAVNEFTELKQQLEKNTVILGVLEQLQEFDSAIEKYNCALASKNYISAARHLEKAHSCLKVLKSRKGCELKLLKSLGIELTVQKQNLLYHLGEEWQQLAVWKLPPSKENSSVEMILKTELHLCTLPSNDESTTGPLLGSVLQAFAILGELNTKLKFFSQLLLNYILKPLVTYPSLHAQMETQQQGVILRFESVETQSEHPPPSEVFIKLRLVFELLHKHLLDVPVEDSPQVSGETGKVVLAEVLGEMIWEEISEAIIKDCLVYSIPNNSSKLVQYDEVINATEEFENALKGMNYLKGDATDLLKYARNVNAHFASKKCQDVIVIARNLMTSEIHNTVKITPDSKITVPTLSKYEGSEKIIKKENHLSQEAPGLENDVKLSQHTFALPTCRISESVQKLMELAYQTLSEATTSSKPCSIQLFYTVRNIFHLFYDVVPTYHKENLQKLPQLSAIHHNNCMYIAHHLLTLGHQFRYHLPSPLSDGAATFVDMVPGFRRLGTESFLAQMRSQKADLLERLSNARNFSNMEDEDNYTAAHKAIRQVIHQLSRLGKVWQDVLPIAIYCKAMGTLLNTAIVEIISKITALEDISTEDGERLYTLCRTMIEEGPLLFSPIPEEAKNKKYQEEVPLYVQKWMKFKEQMIILQASLQEIVDRWADGKGPLAVEFSTSEVKNLIRALFQNTERRAAALAKIK
ncbi:centromere/kinetochore protein zw10 homolog [Xenopus tropicalis]|uniref:Centromere/kinetochore protein zw10 homolog n=1 Tax=Xenopus tropicalis TaxID=8364 RepID=B1H3L7_XENTR|nr:centromere/kinetochore protein zw10 homolog [Xenopus tropicalis]AAI61442.1 zw10 protein [Xenopus tropicalis]|eukprot:NP_001116261.1 centromere/kinetochore protein zw10 homolog [Xenopus tropicalis]